MSDFYTPVQRQLQDEFETRRLAAMTAHALVTEELTPEQTAFIQERDMFFLSTVDETGFPSCSYKGGAPGFVRVPASGLLVFPNYDGNGMFMSLGNIEARSKVGLLFVDFQTPRRLRLRGEARLLRGGPMLKSYPGANVAVEVSIERVWQNCPRYVHRLDPAERSPYLPAEDGTTKLAMWKRIDVVQEVLCESDRAEARSLGLITVEEYEARVERGDLE
ncbi:MAG: pyridoxamine 5'-phosphate oxidase family protein [Planctomycetota bacterium]|jgi:predicted pyridoxine 5'-phosphate oxidase superfamily flavin-nucleotide-binding protein